MLNEKAKSRAQQKLFGIVRSFQKGELENPSPEVEKIASTMSKTDVKKMASTKHDKLPQKIGEDSEYSGAMIKANQELSDKDNKPKPKRSLGKRVRRAVLFNMIKRGKSKETIKKVMHGEEVEPKELDKEIDEAAFLAGLAKVAVAAGKGALKQKAKQAVVQKAANVAQGNVPQPNRDQQQEGVGRAAIGAGIGAMVGGPVGAAVGGSIGAAMGKKKKVTTGGNTVRKKATNFFKAEPKVTSSEELSIVDKMLIEYSPTIVYQDKKKGKLGKSSIYSLRDKDESKKDFRKSHVKDVEDGYVGAGHKPTPGSLKKHEEIETLRKIVEEVGISSSAAIAKAQKEAQLQAKEAAKVAEKKKKKVVGESREDRDPPPQFEKGDDDRGNPDYMKSVSYADEEKWKRLQRMRKASKKKSVRDKVNEAKVDAGKDDEAKEDARNTRRYGHVPYNKHGHSVLRRSEHRMRRGDKKRPGHKEVNVETGKVGKEIGEGVMDVVNRYRKKQKKSPHKYPEGRVYKDPGEAAKRKLKASGQEAVGILPDAADKYPERSSNKK